MSRGGQTVTFILVILLLLPLLCFPAYAASDDDSEGFVSGIISGLKDLFVPDKDYFEDFRDSITSRFDKKFAGVTTALNYLNDRFSNLRAYKDLGGVFKVSFPRDSFLYGISMNLLTTSKDVIAFIRECVTGLVAVSTAILCYRRVIAIVNR